MSYISQSLTFEEDKIYYTQNGREKEVMMDWEDILMSASAAYVTQNGGDILEIGFGMGISAGYIQSASISSHTIIENHPQIIPLAQAWASDKPNVTIVTGSWYENLDNLSVYDGVFYDTYSDHNFRKFSICLPQLVKTGGVATWFNGFPTSKSLYEFEDISYQEFEVNPPQNSYFNHSKYYLPKKQF